MKRNYNKELNAAFNAVKCLDNKDCSEKELRDAVDWFRAAASDYAYHVLRYAPAIEGLRVALRDRGKDDEYAFTLGLSKLLFEGLDVPKQEVDDVEKEQPENVNLENPYYATFERVRRIEKAPASYIYKAIYTGLFDDCYRRKSSWDEISIYVVVGDESDGTELEELGRIDGKVVATASAEDDVYQKSHRREMDLMLTELLKELAEKNALGFVSFATCMEPNSRGVINGRCKSKDLSNELAFYINQAMKENPDRSVASKKTAKNLWEEALMRYERMRFNTEMIEMPLLFSETVDKLASFEEQKRALQFGASAREAHNLLKPYCKVIAEMMKN